MDIKLKFVLAASSIIIASALFTDFKSPQPINLNEPSTLSFFNIEKHANNDVAAAQYVLGTFYLYGHEQDKIEKDSTKAKYWFKKAADHQHGPAAFEYARITENPKDAEFYYRKAISNGFPASIFALAQLKLKEGNPASIKEGIELMYAATEAKDPMAMAFFATLLHEGAGVKKDNVAAVLWLHKASTHAPNPEIKKDWTAKHEQWLAALTEEESIDMNDRLMTDGLTFSPSAEGPTTPGSKKIPGPFSSTASPNDALLTYSK